VASVNHQIARSPRRILIDAPFASRLSRYSLPDRCVTHGLRKAAARRLAEAGCSANEIASITGHATLAEVTRYTKAAEQKQLARSAMGRLAAIPNPIRIPKLPEAFGNSAEKPNEINENLEGWRSLRESNPSFKIENHANTTLSNHYPRSDSRIYADNPPQEHATLRCSSLHDGC